MKYLAVSALCLSLLVLAGSAFTTVASAASGISGTGTTTATVNSGTITINSFGFGNNTTATSNIPQSLAGTSITVNNTKQPFFVWVNASDTSGYASIEYIDAYLHYENGASTNAYNSTAGANMNIHLNLTNTTSTGAAAYTIKMVWPASGSNPTAWLMGSGGYYKYVSGTTANFTFEIYLGSQIHNASATNDNYAWALNVSVSGGGASQSSISPVYFGVNDYESVTITQNTISGSGAPSSTAVYTLGALTLHYSVNNNYVLSLEETNLTGTVGTNTYTLLRNNIGIYNTGSGSFNGTNALSPYYASANSASLPTAISTTAAGAARPFNDTTGPSPGQVSLFGAANTTWANAQQNGVWETITIGFVFQIPIGTVAATYSGTIIWRLWTQDQTFPA